MPDGILTLLLSATVGQKLGQLITFKRRQSDVALHKQARKLLAARHALRLECSTKAVARI
jgi:hypothetical protein